MTVSAAVGAEIDGTDENTTYPRKVMSSIEGAVEKEQRSMLTMASAFFRLGDRLSSDQTKFNRCTLELTKFEDLNGNIIFPLQQNNGYEKKLYAGCTFCSAATAHNLFLSS